MAPAKAHNTLAATRELKLVAVALQMMVPKKRKLATRKAGRLPKYKAVGTQKKFYRQQPPRNVTLPNVGVCACEGE